MKKTKHLLMLFAIACFIQAKAQEASVIPQSFDNAAKQTSSVVQATSADTSKGLLQDEVIVTAFGMQKTKKSIGYSATTIRSDELNKSSSTNMFGTMQGKVAGVEISSVSGTPGGSTKIVIRGFASLSGGSNPLYVVDGVIIDDSRGNSNSQFDFGNASGNINPNDIETMTILKGAAATSLYGSRASNGVILITTKSGKSGDIKVSVFSGTSFTQVGFAPMMQNQFGQGWGGKWISNENGSWGPSLDGKIRLWGNKNIEDNSSLSKPFSFVKDNIANAFDYGTELNNSISVSGGNDLATFYMSYGNVKADGILWGDGDSYNRNTLNLKGSVNYKKISIKATANYINTETKAIEFGQGVSGIGSSFYTDVLQIPTDINIGSFRNYKNKYFGTEYYFTPYAINPYFTLAESGSNNYSNRFFGNVNLNYKITDELTLQIIPGIDVSNNNTKIFRAQNVASSTSPNSSRTGQLGSVGLANFATEQYDHKVNLLYVKKINSFDISGTLGANYNQINVDVFSTGVEALTQPGFYDLSNSINKPQSSQFNLKTRLFGIYASGTFGYNDYIYLNLNLRNDYSSTLPQQNRSYFYPGANISFLLTEFLNKQLNSKTSIINYAKLRFSFAQIGKDAGAYSIFNTVSSRSVGLGFGSINFPFSGVSGYSVSNSLNNTDLRPERTTEFELGGEFKFFNNLIGIDIALYNKISNDQVVSVSTPPSSGYTSKSINFGKIQNKGIEILVNIVPLKFTNFSWELNYTFTKAISDVLELPDELTKLTITSSRDMELVAKKGRTLGILQGPGYQTTPDGKIIVDATGLAKKTADNIEYGTIQRDFSMGLNNVIKYKGVTVSFSIDYRKGGLIYSETAQLLSFTGNATFTDYNSRRPFVIPNSVVEAKNAKGETIYLENTKAIDEAHMDGYFNSSTNPAQSYRNFVLDKTFFKLREVTLGYDFPKTLSQKIWLSGLSISVFARNLFIWLPSTNTIIDPEVTNLGIGLASEFGETRTSPSVRNFGFILKANL